MKPNIGWLHRYGINLHTICGESSKVDQDIVMAWINRVQPNLVNRYSPDCIYNTDETGLFWKMLPESTLVNAVADNNRKSVIQFCFVVIVMVATN